VVRREEDLAERVLLDGDLVYVRAPRKSGKSSLAARLAHRLEKDEAGGGPRIVVNLSLRSIGRNAPGLPFLNALEDRQVQDFRILAGKAGLTADQAAAVRKEAGDSPDWFWAAVAIVARTAVAPVIVFVDEIEQLLGDHSANHRSIGEPWLITLRDLHQQAAGAFTACVLGRLPPRLLVRSPELTPFNTAREIVLPNFTEPQIKDMAQTIGAVFDGMPMAGILARAVYRQTAGQPNQTQCLLRALNEAYDRDMASIAEPSEVIEAFVTTDPECQPSTSNTYMDIDDTFDRPSVWPAHDALVVYGEMLRVAVEAGANIDPAVRYDAWSDAHLMLEAVGLAQAETREDGQHLVARSRIARRLFNRQWVIKRRTGIGGQESSTYGQASRDLVEMETLARQELCRTDWAVEHKVSLTPGSGREVVGGALFEFELVRELPPERLTLQLFRGVGDFGKRLWLRQVRTLRQLSDRAAALPHIYRGGLLDGEKVAYIITQRPELTLADPGFADYVSAHRGWAMNQFVSLADGLSRMVEEGVSHRNIWPGAVRLDAPDEHSAPPQMKLASFEFSVMLRSVVGGDEDHEQQARHRKASLRAAFLRQPPTSRPFASPELLAGLFGDGGAPIPTSATGDVFSLGMLALGWFMPFPAPVAFETVLKQTGGGDAVYDAEAHLTYLNNLGGEIEQAIARRRIPATLGRLLRAMIEPEVFARLLPEEVVQTLDGLMPSLRAWASDHRRQPLLACYSYQELSAELHRQGAITTHLGTEADQLSVEEILERETANAVLFHAPLGIAPFFSNPNADHKAAQWVLMGPTWLFYCQRFHRRAGGFGSAREETKHVLRIAYAWPRRRAWRGVPAKHVKLSAYGSLQLAEQRGSPILDRANDARFREWDAILAEAQRSALPPSFQVAQTAFSWVVEAQRQELELQRFPIRRVGPAGAECKYKLDDSEYRRWRDRNIMRSQVSQAEAVADPNERFEQILRDAVDEGDKSVLVRPFSRPTEGHGSVATITEISGAGITLKGRSLPSQAWIELGEAWRARRPIYQQETAIHELTETPGLFDQLLQPHVIVDEELFNEDHLQRAVSSLAGRSAEIVRKIVTSSPLVALQGPPGTGKTTIIAAVIQSLLEMDQTQRILVTSQSNAAVDNIALRILDLGLTQEDRAICVRVASPEAFKEDGSVDPRVKALRPELVAERIAYRLRKDCAEKLAAEIDPRLRKAYATLASAADGGCLELIERVRESAAVVFATTAGTRRVVDEGFLPAGTRFDMAIIDEASKAWPTEIVQPMLLASRNLMVGDHRQLPAFGSTDMEHLLAQCITSGHEEFRVLANHRQAISAWLKLFATFFDPENAKYVGTDDGETLPGWRDNRAVAEQLHLQFRMRSDIADVVSRAFYKNKLESHPSVDLRERPAWLRDFAAEVGAPGGILWIDTPLGDRFYNTSPSVNEDQAQIAARLLARAVELGADPRRDAVILSPYKLQRGLIRAQLISRHDTALAEAVHTADSFQGREADLVILPLTRGPPPLGRDAGKATQRYGFLVQEERANVMMSRGRELLVILGDFDFFADAVRVEQKNNPEYAMDLGFWSRLCERISRTGRVINWDELPPKFRLK